MNELYYGDCLDVLKDLNRKHPEGFIDLIYIDPPFNSKRNYNVLFEDINLDDTKAQKEAFADTWSNVTYFDTLNEIQDLDLDLYGFLKALDNINIRKSAISYLTTMSIRIWYMHKVLRDTGSFYLHCDPNMSHYLKILCDLIFEDKNFKNEIIWKRKFGIGQTNKKSDRFGQQTDTILFYSKTKKQILNSQYVFDDEYQKYVDKYFKYIDENGRKYWADNLASPSFRKNLVYEYKGYKPPKKGWAISKEKMELWDKIGKLVFPKKKDGLIKRKRYADELKGRIVQNLWNDVSGMGGFTKNREDESLGYPTQKPIALLERIIQASSNEGDIVADFFCGCGTTIAAANKLNRQWIGVDISHLAVRLIIKRLLDPYPPDKQKEMMMNISITGFPRDPATAKEMAENPDHGRLKFQDWIIEVMLNGVANPKKTADGGWDGYITFDKGMKEKGLCVIEVKSGHCNVKNLREFVRVVTSQGADIGVFVCFAEQVTKPMRIEAKQAGIDSRFDVDKIQIITVEDLLDRRGEIKFPGGGFQTTFKKSSKRVDVEEEE
ncbi:DNA methyltransferase, partial [Bacteroidota bacterium]